jgi:hypothetical protein
MSGIFNITNYIYREMRIISFDVGMKNLAYCIFSISDTIAFTGVSASELIHHIKIERWDVIDLRFEPNLSASPLSEVAQPPPKRLCMNDTKLAKWMLALPPAAPLDIIMYCSKCAEKSKYKIPCREILPIKRKPELLLKKKLGELMDIKACIGTTSSSQSLEPGPATTNLKLRKSDLIEEIKTTLTRDYMEPFDEQKYSNYIAGVPETTVTKPKKANYTYAHDLDLITYGRNMMKHLDLILSECSGPINMMIIENQISTLASRMKTLQGMITQYFIMKQVSNIEFISASCKLKLFMNTPISQSLDSEVHTGADDGGGICIDAATYADRKKSGIAVCRWLGEISRKHKSDYVKWMPVFENHKKKDDLADCFLQGLWRVHSTMCGIN